jgi:hypothetical protein
MRKVNACSHICMHLRIPGQRLPTCATTILCASIRKVVRRSYQESQQVALQVAVETDPAAAKLPVKLGHHVCGIQHLDLTPNFSGHIRADPDAIEQKKVRAQF